MKNFAILAVLGLSVLGCNLSNLVKSADSADPNSTQTSPTPKATASPSPSPKPEPEATAEKPAFIAILKKSAGKYPSDIKLIENPEIKSRLQKLLGKDWPDMKAKFDVEMPNEVEDNIFKGEACEAHNCGDNRYIIYVDLGDGNINVFHIESGKTKKYLENGEIELPEKFAKDLAGG